MTEMTRPTNFRRNLLPAVLLLSLGMTGAAAAQVIPSAAAATIAASSANQSAIANPGPAIAGFRNATFGMTQAQVRSAIETEFKLQGTAIKAGENDIQHTAVLNIQVPDLVPGGGTANVAYVFGYQTHKLIEVNILWSKVVDPNITPQMIYQNGQSLQQYFAGEGFPPQRSTGNIATPDGVLLFRATDPTGNAILLILSGTMAKDQKSDKSTLTPAALTLAYAANPQHPDVFQLNKGSF
jgi:hypothetical protein